MERSSCVGTSRRGIPCAATTRPGAPAAVASLATLINQGRVELAFVYGSVASGKTTARSDVDLLVVGDVSLTEIVPALRTAEARLGREVNPSVYPVKEFRDKMKHDTPFLKRILAGPKLFVTGDDRVLGRLAR